MSCGLSGRQFDRELRAERTRERLESEIHAALESGVFGVPSFVVDGEVFWGSDRLALVRHRLVRGSIG